MRIPRKYILEQRELINQLNSIKFVHYRDLNSEIDRTNFHICTKVDFKPIEKNPEHKDIHETWGRLKHNTPHQYYYISRKSSSKSEYIIDENDNVYRFSDHWGAVASCEWTREGQGQLMMSIFETGNWEIGVANLKDFKLFRRSVDRRKDFVINPKWIEEMKNFVHVKELLTKFKNSEEFTIMSKDRKKFIGENFGFFRKIINDYYKYSES